MATRTLQQGGGDPAVVVGTGRGRLWWLLGGIAALVIVGGGLLVARWVDASGRVQPGVQVAGVAVGGMRPAEAAQAIQQQLGAVTDTQVELRAGDRTWTFAAKDLGVALDATTTAQRASAAGGPVTGTAALAFTHDQSQAAGALATLKTGLAVAPVDAKFAVTDGGVTTQAAVPGQALDESATWAAIVAATDQYPFSPVDVRTVPVKPAVTDADLGAAAVLAHRLSDEPVVLTTTLDDQPLTWTFDPATLRGMIDVTTDASGKPVVAETLNAGKLRALLQPAADRLARDPVNASLELPDFQTVVTLHPDVAGRRLDIDTTSRRIQAAAQAAGAGRTISLAILDVPAPVQAAALQPIKDRLDRVMTTGVTMHYGDKAYLVTGKRLAGILYLTPGADGTPDSYQVTISDNDAQRVLQAIGKEIGKPVREVTYRLVNNQITLVSAPADGLGVDVAQSAANLKAAALAGQSDADLVTTVVHPSSAAVDPSTIQTPDLLAGGSTFYGYSSAERNWNVTYGASKLDGWYVAPGAVFSMDDALGPLTLAAGFKMGWAILVQAGNATTIPSEAGGICQVNTTLFHQVFYAGLPVVEYHHHSYWISTYGQPPQGITGLDATISPPDSDFKFRNTTGNWLLIRANGDHSNISVKLYGTNPGWHVQVKPPVITNVVKTDPTLRHEFSDKLPNGRVVVVEHAQDGFTATIERTVTDRTGQVIDHWVIKNDYLPSHNTDVTGTGPGGTPTATPAPIATATPTPAP